MLNKQHHASRVGVSAVVGMVAVLAVKRTRVNGPSPTTADYVVLRAGACRASCHADAGEQKESGLYAPSRRASSLAASAQSDFAPADVGARLVRSGERGGTGG
jgi:hypothetical protein